MAPAMATGKGNKMATIQISDRYVPYATIIITPNREETMDRKIKVPICQKK